MGDADGVPERDGKPAPEPQPGGASENAYTGLSSEHANQMRASGISPDIARERGYRTVYRKAELRKLGFAPAQCNVPALLIPIWSVHGEVATYQVRPDEPRRSRRTDKVLKYENIKGGRMVLDVPSKTRVVLGNPKVPLLVTEGSKKVDALHGVGLFSIGVLGVWNWRGRNDEGGKAALADLELIAWNDRLVHVVFDSDVMTKVEVYRALVRLANLLRSREAHVRFIYLPSGPAGVKTGVDDFLVAGNTVDELLALASDELRRPPLDDEAGECPYEAQADGLWWRRVGADGTSTLVQLTNFTAKIVAQIVLDDGETQTTSLDVEASCGTVKKTLRLTPAEFQDMDWPIARLDARAWVAPGVGTAQRATIAIQTLSGDIPTRTVHAHLGWRHIERNWSYVHAGGAIGERGPVADVAVEVTPDLGRMVLPPPAAGARLEECAAAAFNLLALGPPRIAFPLFALPFCAVLRRADFVTHLEGESGAFKSARAAISQAHFGRDFNDRTLPASWLSTPNANLRLAHEAKDGFLTIDDFNPRGTMSQIAQKQREADELVRSVGNGAGRKRMRRDGSLQTTYLPRGTILSTGETVPTGQSTVARMLVLPLQKGDIDPRALARCQQDAADGKFAELVSSFISWIAPQYDAIQSGIDAELLELRKAFECEGDHRRLAPMLAQLALGFRFFGRFAVAKTLVPKESIERIERDAIRALQAAAARQRRHQTAAAPHEAFVELVGAALSSGRAHLAAPSGGLPDDGPRWGWRSVPGASDDRHDPQGDRIGYVNGGEVLLVPAAILAVIQRMASASCGEAFPVTSTTALGRLLRDHALLVETDDKRETLTLRRRLEGRDQKVFVMAASVFGAAAPTEGDEALAPIVADEGVF